MKLHNEHDRVKTLARLPYFDDDNEPCMLPAETQGTIVSVHAMMEQYVVEFIIGKKNILLDLNHNQVEKI